MISIKKEVYEEIVKKLKEEAEYYEAIVRKFEKKYNCSLERSYSRWLNVSLNYLEERMVTIL